MNPEQSNPEMKNEQNDLAGRMQDILDSISKDGPGAVIEPLSEISDTIFSEEFVSQLRSRGVEAKAHEGGSANKLEFFIELKLPKGERQIVVRYENGGRLSLRVIDGVWDGENVISEEQVSGTLDEVADKARKLAEETISK
jgi:hypothetical protein